jgi:hypothetical protein
MSLSASPTLTQQAVAGARPLSARLCAQIADSRAALPLDLAFLLLAADRRARPNQLGGQAQQAMTVRCWRNRQAAVHEQTLAAPVANRAAAGHRGVAAEAERGGVLDQQHRAGLGERVLTRGGTVRGGQRIMGDGSAVQQAVGGLGVGPVAIQLRRQAPGRGSGDRRARSDRPLGPSPAAQFHRTPRRPRPTRRILHPLSAKPLHSQLWVIASLGVEGWDQNVMQL